MAVPVVAEVVSGPNKVASDGQTSIAANLPTSISAGDLLLMCVHNAYPPTNFTMSGFTKLVDASVGGSFGMEVWYRVATGSEGATQTIGGFNNTDTLNPVCFRVTGATATPGTDYDHDFMTQTYGTSATSPASTSAVNDSLVLRWLANRPTDGTATASGTPSSHTRIFTNSQANGSQFWASQDAGAAAGAVSTAAWSGLGTENWGAGTLVIAPAAAANPTITSATITGTSQVGQTLTANVVTGQDPVDSIAYQWQKAATDDAEPGTDISGETSSTLALTYADFGDLLDTAAYVRVQAVATKNSLDSDEESSAWQAVTAPTGGGGASNLTRSPFIVG